jgi:hypothetical protein
MSQSAKTLTTLGTLHSFMLGGRACSDTHYWALNKALGSPMPAEEKAAMPLAGGIMMHGHQCGMLWGAALAAGTQAQQRFGAGPKAESMAVEASQKAATVFKGQNGSLNCMDLCGIRREATPWQIARYFFIKGGVVACARRMARFNPVALSDISATLENPATQQAQGPVSCAAEAVRGLGGTPEQAAQAAGLAGGIGLSGGACGALGAAVWLMALRRQQQGGKPMDIKDTEADAMVGRFLDATGKRFLCQDICGRNFDNLEDHADHIAKGGCAHVMAALSGKP